MRRQLMAVRQVMEPVGSRGGVRPARLLEELESRILLCSEHPLGQEPLAVFATGAASTAVAAAAAPASSARPLQPLSAESPLVNSLVGTPAVAMFTVVPAGKLNSSWDSHLTFSRQKNGWVTDSGRLVAEAGTPTLAASADGVAQSAWTTGSKTVLYLRVKFSDQTAEPQSLSSAVSMMNNVNTFMQSNSYNLLSFVTTAPDYVYTLPNTAAWYSANDSSGYANNVLQAAIAVAANPADSRWASYNPSAPAYNYASYNLYAVRYTGGPGSFSGQAWVGSAGVWMKSSSDGVAAHEFGHNLGLWHANYWDPTDDITAIGPGSNNEYGDPYSTMGPASGGNQHFSAYEKAILDWIPAANVTTATASSGTYRLYPNDLGGTFDASRQYAIKVNKDGDRVYWLSFRQNGLTTNNRWLTNGVEVRWDPWANSNDGAQWIDTTPLTPDGKNDGTVTIGRTWSDTIAGVHITPIALTGTTPQSVDVVVNVGQFPGNSQPTASFTSSATTVATNAAVTFSATASDPDGDVLAYFWDFGDKSFSTNNSPTQSKSWSTAGDYRVRLVVSDMKGKSWSGSVLIRVGSPAVANRISGTVLDGGGNPVADALVNNGLATNDANYRYGYTDADGRYTLVGVPAGSFSITAQKAGWTFARSGFVNPVQVAPDADGINFVASQRQYKISGKVTDVAGAGIRGVLVSDGTRTEVTDSSGNYTFYNQQMGSYTLTASKTGYSFNSVSASLEFGDATGVNFTERTYYVSGQLTGPTSSTDLTTLTVTDGIRTSTVTKSGSGGNTKYNYTISSIPGTTANLRVVDSTNATSYSPSNFTNPLNITSNPSTRNFTKDSSVKFGISGRVTDLGDGLAGATVTASGPVIVNGTTDSRGYFWLPGLTAGAYTVTASMAGLTFAPASQNITISASNATASTFTSTRTNPAPTVAMAAAATPNPVTALTVNLAALGADDAGEQYLLYTWSTPTAPSGASTSYSANGANSARNTTATLTRAGNYVFRVTIRDVYGATATSDVAVTVNQTLTALSITPNPATLPMGSVFQFNGSALDQFGQPMAIQPAMAWAATGGGTMTTSGLFTASTPGSYMVSVSAAGLSRQGVLNVTYAAGTGTGLYRELWSGISGTTVANLTSVINAGTPPTLTGYFDASTGFFEAPTNTADNYGQRVRGYYLAPATGTYTFWIASDDSSELWLSTDASPANKVKIASVSGSTGSREWTKFSTQRSVGINLVAGNQYYIEALMKEGTGSDNLAVRTDLPGGISETPAPYHRFNPYLPVAPTVAPASLAANAVSGSRVDLAWSYAGTGQTGFKLDRATDTAFAANLVTVSIPGAGTTSYSDTTVVGGTTYYYRLRATNAIGDSENSSTASATTPGANQAPTVVNAAAASPSPVTGTTTVLTVLGADDGLESNLTYSWSVVSKPAAAASPTFSASGTNAAKSSTATFYGAGVYTLRATISDGSLTVSSDVGVTVSQTLTSLSVTPGNASIAFGQTLAFSATGADQFGAAMGAIGGVTWSLVAGSPGMISSAGLYTAPGSGAGGMATVRAVSGALSGQTQLTVGSVLFADNFEAGASQWTVTSASGGNTYSVITDGTQRYQSLHTSTSSVNRATAGSTAWTDYVLLATYKVTDNSAGGNGSLMARVQDDSHWYGFTYDKPAQKWKIYYKNGSNTVDLASAAATSTLTVGADYALRIEAQGSALRLYVNNVLTVSASDSQYANGKIGWSSYQATASIDNVVVAPFNTAPTVAIAASAGGGTISAPSANLTILGNDDGGEGALTYAWTVVSKPAAPLVAPDPTFSANASNAAKNTTVTFAQSGDYTLRATITDAGGLSVTSDIALTVDYGIAGVTAAPGAAFSTTYADGAYTLWILGGTVTLASDVGASGRQIGLKVSPGAAAVINATQHLTTLDLGENATAAMPVLADGNFLALKTLLLAAGAQLDLANNDLVIDYSGATPYAQVNAWLRSGFNGGTWDGAGIISSSARGQAGLYALGIRDNSTLLRDTFNGEAVSTHAVIVKFTYAGDSNLSGTYDTTDLFTFLPLYDGGAANTWTWAEGDLNYDGWLNTTDLFTFLPLYNPALPAI